MSRKAETNPVYCVHGVILEAEPSCSLCSLKERLDKAENLGKSDAPKLIERHVTKYPTVIWMGKEPLHPRTARRYRIVDRGPARPGRSDDVPFALEQRTGQSMMKRLNWGPCVNESAKDEAIHALTHAIGLLLTVEVGKLRSDHPLHCDINMAIVEGREAKGCDCDRPEEPEERT